MLYSPSSVVANDLPAADPVTPTQAPTPETKTEPTPNPGTGTNQTPTLDAKALLAAINADREHREKASRDASERETYKAQLEAAQAKLNEIEKAKKNRLLDPAGFLRKLGYTDRDLALTSEGIMFTLMPDKAPPGWVANLVKAQREQDQEDAAEKDKQREVEAQKHAAETSTAQEKEIEARYQRSLESEVAAFAPGTFKASQAWYAEDHKAYAQELYDTARALAEQAVKAGQVIDVSGRAIASHVEKKYADRASRLVAAYGTSTPAAKPQSTQPPQPAPKQAPSQLEESSATVYARSKPGMTDKELIEKATKAAFGLR